MAEGQKLSAFPACFVINSALSSTIERAAVTAVSSKVANCHPTVRPAIAYNCNVISRAEDITANAANQSLLSRNERPTRHAWTYDRSTEDSASSVTTSPITIVSSMFCTLKLSGNIGHLCGSTDYPVCL